MKTGLDLLAEHKGVRLDPATVAAEDPRTYAMNRKAKHPRHLPDRELHPDVHAAAIEVRTNHDLVVQVAIVRPGPIQGDMMRFHLRPRDGLGEVSTFGVPLFKKQAMRVAIGCAGFTLRQVPRHTMIVDRLPRMDG